MRVYMSTYDAARRVVNNAKVVYGNGWAHLIEMTHKYLVELGGVDIVDSPEDGDVELFIGHPPMQLKPQLHPAIILTMTEATGTPKLWVDSMNNYDTVLTPSLWGVNNFVTAGIRTSIKLCHLCVDTERFTYIDRDIDFNGYWVYLSQSVFPSDRKGSDIVKNAFLYGQMPEDTFLIVKSRPHKKQDPFEGLVDEQVYLYYKTVPYEVMMDEILGQCHVSVNPSSGEGFGFIPLEHQLTGMLSIQTHYSGLDESFDPSYNLPINYIEVPTKLMAYGGHDAEPDYEHMIKQILWSYENREESLRMGRMASAWVAETFSPMKYATKLIDCFEEVICRVPKSVELYDESRHEEWVYVKGGTWIEN